MRTLIFTLCSIISLNEGFTQGNYTPSNHATFVTVSAGFYNENYLRLEHDITDKYMIVQGSAYFGEEGYGLQYKMGAGYAGKKFRVYAYIPYLNLSLSGSGKTASKGYNTPFCIEGFYGNKHIQTSINIDFYKDLIVPSIRLRYQLTKFRA